MNPELETIIWRDNTDDISPLTTIPGVALTPPIGAHITIRGNRYEVTATPEITYQDEARYNPDGSRRAGEVSVVLTVRPVDSSKGF